MFGDINNSDMLKNLVSAYLGIDTEGEGKFELSNTEITPEELRRKFARLDLRISTEKSEIDVEVQVLNTLDYNDRCLYYWASLYTSSVPRGEEYREAKQTMSLNILDFKMFDCESFNTNFVFFDPQNNITLSDKARIMFVELPKIPIRGITPEQIRSDDRVAWAAFFNARKKEEFDMLKESSNNPNVQKAVTVIRELSADDRIREEARKRENALRDEQSALYAHYKKGVAEGIDEGILIGIDRGINIGMDKGRAEGITIGMDKGRAERDEEIIANLRKMGFSQDQIEQALNGQKPTP